MSPFCGYLYLGNAIFSNGFGGNVVRPPAAGGISPG